MTIKLCRSCHSPLINRRSHAVTCSSKCRNVVWRQTKSTIIPVRIMFSFSSYALVKNAANAAGIPINQFVHDRLVQTVEASQW